MCILIYTGTFPNGHLSITHIFFGNGDILLFPNFTTEFYERIRL